MLLFVDKFICVQMIESSSGPLWSRRRPNSGVKRDCFSQNFEPVLVRS